MTIGRLDLTAFGVAAAVIPTLAWGQGPSDLERCQYGPHMMWWGGGWAGMMFGPIFMIVAIAAAVWLVLLFARSVGGPWHAPPPARTPLDILKERFARGEIDKQEYDDRRRVLGE
jgi:putative membrane protein